MGPAAVRAPDWAAQARGRRDATAAPRQGRLGAGDAVERATMTPARIRSVYRRNGRRAVWTSCLFAGASANLEKETRDGVAEGEGGCCHGHGRLLRR
jgi:hypothetical protein